MEAANQIFWRYKTSCSDLSANSFINADLCLWKNLIRRAFEKIMTKLKIILLDSHYKTFYKSVRTESSSCGV